MHNNKLNKINIIWRNQLSVLTLFYSDLESSWKYDTFYYNDLVKIY